MFTSDIEKEWQTKTETLLRLLPNTLPQGTALAQTASSTEKYDREGYDKDGYDREGYDKNGHISLENESQKLGDSYVEYREMRLKQTAAERGFNEYGVHKRNSWTDKRGFKVDGRQENGSFYDANGYDVFGFDQNGINVKGFDYRGNHQNGTKYDDQGFDMYGRYHGESLYDDDGYDADGFNESGFNRAGYDRDGRTYDARGFDQSGRHRNGTAYDENGYTWDGFDKCGYDKEGFNRDGYDKEGFDRKGFDRSGYDREGYDRDGYDWDGYDRNDIDCHSIAKPKERYVCTVIESYKQIISTSVTCLYMKSNLDILDKRMERIVDAYALNKIIIEAESYASVSMTWLSKRRKPYKRLEIYCANEACAHEIESSMQENEDQASNKNVFVMVKRISSDEARNGINGYDLDGYNADGYDVNGYDRRGFDHDGYRANGYNEDGFDREGYDANGYDRDGFDRYGRDANGNGKSADQVIDNLNQRIHSFAKRIYLSPNINKINERMAETFAACEQMSELFITASKISFSPKAFSRVKRLHGLTIYCDNREVRSRILGALNKDVIRTLGGKPTIVVKDFTKERSDYYDKKIKEHLQSMETLEGKAQSTNQ